MKTAKRAVKFILALLLAGYMATSSNDSTVVEISKRYNCHLVAAGLLPHFKESGNEC